jgi:hypothetical protein
MESTNPAGYALSLEIGYGKALGKRIILVEQHPDMNRERHFSMIRATSDDIFENLDDAIKFLKSLS